jgi:hypothetical protein
MKRIIAITTVAAALLLGGTAHAAGWYLLRPPAIDIDNRHVQIHTEWPLWTWNSNGSYDTAAECRTALDKEHTQLLKTIQFMKERVTDEQVLSKSVKNMLISSGSMQCVATGDPRLNRR